MDERRDVESSLGDVWTVTVTGMLGKPCPHPHPEPSPAALPA